MSPSSGLRVQMHPVARAGNPYTALLAKSLQQQACVVEEFSPGVLGRHPGDVLHVHWPEQLLTSSSPWRSRVKAARALFALDAFRARGGRVVWTGHNVTPHHPGRGSDDAHRRFLERVDGVVHLSRTGRSLIELQHPVLADKPSVLVPHGDLACAYPRRARAASRRELGVLEDEVVVLLFGRMKGYRGVEALLEQFHDAPVEWRLHVVGPCHDPVLRSRLERSAARGAHRIRLDLRMQQPDELAQHLAAADLVVQPFEDVLHSGTVHLALGVGRTVLAPALGALPEQRESVGGRLVLYHGPLDLEHVRRALRKRGDERAVTPQEASEQWHLIGRRHVDLYRELRAV